MASGKTHDLSTWILAPIVVLAWMLALQTNLSSALWAGAGCLFGGLYLSPDLDTPSRPYFRWGWLRWIWQPYQWAARHRSVLSHSLFLGPLLRLMILGSVIFLFFKWGWPLLWNALLAMLQENGLNQPAITLQKTLQTALKDHPLLTAHILQPSLWGHGLMGCWLGMTLHLVLDAIWDRFHTIRTKANHNKT